MIFTLSLVYLYVMEKFSILASEIEVNEGVFKSAKLYICCYKRNWRHDSFDFKICNTTI